MKVVSWACQLQPTVQASGSSYKLLVSITTLVFQFWTTWMPHSNHLLLFHANIMKTHNVSSLLWLGVGLPVHGQQQEVVAYTTCFHKTKRKLSTMCLVRKVWTVTSTTQQHFGTCYFYTVMSHLRDSHWTQTWVCVLGLFVHTYCRHIQCQPLWCSAWIYCDHWPHANP